MQWCEVKYQPERSHTYLGSPSIVRLVDGTLVVTHDYFGPGCPRNLEAEESLTSVYRSEDNGVTWRPITHIMNCFWSTLFTHSSSLYLLGTTQQYGSICIRRSDDGGYTWTHPADDRRGLLYTGGAYHDPPNYHCAPVPVLHFNRRLYKGFEDCSPLKWGTGFQACVISAPDDADLLDAGNWTMSNKLAFDPAWMPAAWGLVEIPGWLEGNVIDTPSGNLVNILRLNTYPFANKAAVVNIHEQGCRVTFDPGNGLIDFPGGMTKFTIRRDPKTGSYLALVNPVTESAWPNQRNTLCLSESADLLHWRVVATLMVDDSGLGREDSLRLTGFQYVDWQFDGDDIIYVVRAAYRGALNFHDSNRVIFRILRHYAELIGT